MKWLYAALGLVVLVIAIGAFVGVYVVSTLNKETGQANALNAKQRDNQSELDNTIKKISQTGQVTVAQKEALKEIIVGHAEARSAGKQGGSLANWIHEAVPNVDTSTFNNLQNLIAASRDRWTMQQKELLDLNREHDNTITMFPSSLVCSLFGRKKIDVTIVTSTRTEEAFKTGKDDDISVFPDKKDVPK